MKDMYIETDEDIMIIDYSAKQSIYINEFNSTLKEIEVEEKRIGLCLDDNELIMPILQCLEDYKCIIEFLNSKLFKDSIGEANEYLDYIITDKEIIELKYNNKIVTNLFNKKVYIFFLENSSGKNIKEKIYVYYTSGSTGRPKKVYKKEKAVLDEARAIVQRLKLSDEDMILCVASCNHVFAQSVACFAALEARCKVVYLSPLSSPNNVINKIKKYDFSILLASPIYYEFLCDFYKELSKIRLLLTGGAKLSDKVLNSELKITNFYGSTETGIIAVNDERKKQKEYVGEVLKEVKIVWKDNYIYKHCREISICSPFNAYKICEGNYEIKIEDLINLHDIGYQKANDLYIVGRTDNIVNIYGMKISCLEVEQIINKCQQVDKAIVTKYRDATGEHMQAYVKMKVKSIENEKVIREFCLQKLEKCKIPSKITFVNNILYNEIGKIRMKDIGK